MTLLQHAAAACSLILALTAEPEAFTGQACAEDLSLLQQDVSRHHAGPAVDLEAISASLDTLELPLRRLESHINSTVPAFRARQWAAQEAPTPERLLELERAARSFGNGFRKAWAEMQKRLLQVGATMGSQRPQAAKSVEKMAQGMALYMTDLGAARGELYGAAGQGCQSWSSVTRSKEVREAFSAVWENWEQALEQIYEGLLQRRFNMAAAEALWGKLVVQGNLLEQRLMDAVTIMDVGEWCPGEEKIKAIPGSLTAEVATPARIPSAAQSFLGKGQANLDRAVARLSQFKKPDLTRLRESLRPDLDPKLALAERGRAEQDLHQAVAGFLGRWDQFQAAVAGMKSGLEQVPAAQPAVEDLLQAAGQFREQLASEPLACMGLAAIPFASGRRGPAAECSAAFDGFLRKWREVRLVTTQALAGAAPAGSETSQSLADYLTWSMSLLREIRTVVYDLLSVTIDFRDQ